MRTSQFKLLSLAGAVLIGLSACSSDDSETTVKLSGVVADGYLKDAIVCLDLNENKACDADEPQAVTDVDGKYSFDAGSGDSESFPVISVITTDTRDADDPDRVMAPYVMSAPAGRPEFISPMTTMIQTELESNPGISIDSAENSVKTNLGYSATSTISLFKNYVEAKGADSTESDLDKADYKRIHRIARVTARTLEANHALIETAAEAAGLNKDDVLNELVRLVVKDVIANLKKIIADVDDNIALTDAAYNPDTILSTFTPLDTQSLEDDIASEEAVSSAQFINITALLEKGIHFLRGEWSSNSAERSFDIEKITLDTSVSSSTLLMTSEMWDGTDWIAETQSTDRNGYCQAITATGIVRYNCDGAQTITDNGDGTASLLSNDSDGNAIERATIRGSKANLSGKLIRGVVRNEKAWEKAIPGNALFGEGSMGYRWNFTTQNEVYRIHYEEAESGGTCADLGYGSGLTNSQNCLALRSSMGEKDATTLDDVTDGVSEYYVGRDLSAIFTKDDGGDVLIGSIKFIIRDNTGNILDTDLNGKYTIEKPMGGTVKVLVFEVPTLFRFSQDNDKDTKLFIVIEDGYARMGGIRASGVSESEDDFSLDLAAVDSAKNCFMGGKVTAGVGSCPVRLLLRDNKLPRVDGKIVKTVESGVMKPYILPAAVSNATTLKFSTNDTDTRWTFTLGDVTATANEKGWRDGTFTPTMLNDAGVLVDRTENSIPVMLDMKWKVTLSGKLKMEYNYEIPTDKATIERPAGTYYDVWIVTELDNAKTHLRFKRFNKSLSNERQEKNFGAYVTLM